MDYSGLYSLMDYSGLYSLMDYSGLYWTIYSKCVYIQY